MIRSLLVLGMLDLVLCFGCGGVALLETTDDDGQGATTAVGSSSTGQTSPCMMVGYGTGLPLMCQPRQHVETHAVKGCMDSGGSVDTRQGEPIAEACENGGLREQRYPCCYDAGLPALDTKSWEFDETLFATPMLATRDALLAAAQNHCQNYYYSQLTDWLVFYKETKPAAVHYACAPI